MNQKRTAWLLVFVMTLAGCERQVDQKALANGVQAHADARPSVSSKPLAVPEALPIKPGIYGNVQYVEEAGDLVGTEIEIHDGPEHAVDVTLCEGDCNWIVKTTYTAEQGTIKFTYRVPTTNRDETSGPDLVLNFRARPDGTGIKLDGHDDIPAERLKLLKKRYGLDIADQAMKDYPDKEKSRSGGGSAEGSL